MNKSSITYEYPIHETSSISMSTSIYFVLRTESLRIPNRPFPSHSIHASESLSKCLSSTIYTFKNFPSYTVCFYPPRVPLGVLCHSSTGVSDLKTSDRRRKRIHHKQFTPHYPFVLSTPPLIRPGLSLSFRKSWSYTTTVTEDIERNISV